MKINLPLLCLGIMLPKSNSSPYSADRSYSYTQEEYTPVEYGSFQLYHPYRFIKTSPNYIEDLNKLTEKELPCTK